MNKKLLIALVIIVLLVYYLNSEPKPTRKQTELWLIPQSKSRPSPLPKNETVQPKIQSPSIPKEIKSALTKPLATDYSWLTDDNLEYILKNWELVQTALTKANQTQRKFSLRTDLANIYNCFYKARTNQDWDLPEFLERLEDNKAAYTLFPLRVNGNHWGLFVLEEILREPAPEPPMEPGTVYFPSAQLLEVITKVYYTSSGAENLETEKKQLQPFINQIVGQNTPISTIKPKDRNSQGYECGVYLCFYIREMIESFKQILETGKLELNREYTETECQKFRREWKAKIGEKWGKWD